MSIPFTIERRLAYSALLIGLICLGAGCEGPKLMPTPNLFVGTGNDPLKDTPEVFRDNTVDVLYVTDRAPDDEADSLQYSSERSKSLAFGSSIVQIGQDVSWDALRADSQTHKRSKSLPLSIQKNTELGRYPATPLPVKYENGRTFVDPEAIAKRKAVAAQFQAEVSRRLSHSKRKEAYVYVHGYANSFEDGAFIIADLWHFIGRQGVPIAYTWPAGHAGLFAGYEYDTASSQFTVFHFKNFIRDLAECPDLEKIHVIAHSRGTAVVTNGVRELAIEARAAGLDGKERFKIGNVVLAAADLDLEVTEQRVAAEQVFGLYDRLTLYVSETDKALGLSNWLFSGAGRLGRTTLQDLTDEMQERIANIHNITFVEANLKTGFIGHSYFHTNPAVSSDLILVLRDNRPPGKEHGRPLTNIGPAYWSISKGYPNTEDK